MSITKKDKAFLSRLRSPKHWTEADARRVLALHEASGLSRAAFAREYDLHIKRLGWWKRRLAATGAQMERGGHEAKAAEFVQLVVHEAPARVAARARVGEVVVELAELDAASARFVVQLSRALGDDACC